MYQPDPIQRLIDVDYSRNDNYGERACSLSRFMSKGYKVPYGLVISTKVFKRFLNTMPGAKRIDHLILELNLDNLEKIAQEIQDIIMGSPLPMPMANSIADKIFSLMSQIKSKSVVLRTSAHIEDSSRHMCYGRGVYFHMKDMRNIIQIIKNCWASAYALDVLHDLLISGLPPDTISIAIIVEEMIEARVSGILSVKVDDPKEAVYIRANWGTKVFEGKDGIWCDHIMVDERKIGEPIETFTSYKENISLIPPDNQHAVIVENEPKKKRELALSQQEITVLTQLAKRIRHDFEIDYEVEFIFDEKGTLWLLDAIPRTNRRHIYRIGKNVINTRNSQGNI